MNELINEKQTPRKMSTIELSLIAAGIWKLTLIQYDYVYQNRLHVQE